MRTIFIRRLVTFSASTLFVVGTLHYSSSSSSGGSTPPASKQIGASGGTVSSSDGSLDVTIPAGALSSNVTITVARIAAPPSGVIGTAYDVGPSGTKFNAPVKMTFHYSDADLGGHAASDLRVATASGQNWQVLSGASEDTTAHTVTGTTTHLSPYGVVAAASAQVCVHLGGGVACAAGAPSSGGSGSPPPSGGGTPTCSAPTCAGSNPCAGYDGASLDSCTDGTNGYDAVCCWPAGQPICVSGGGAATACASGPSGGTCPPPPTCAQATNTCPNGSTQKSCTDTSSGYTTVCCYPPGVSPFSDSSSGSGSTAARDAGAPTGVGGGSGGTADAGAPHP